MPPKTKQSVWKKPWNSWFSKSPPHNRSADALQNAAQFTEAGDFERAKSLLHKALETDPENDIVLHRLGLVYHKLADNEQGLSLFARAIAINSTQAAYHYDKGVALIAQRRFAEAEACFRTAIKLDPRYSRAHNFLGQLFLSRAEWEQAKGCFERAIRADPNYADAHKNLGHVCARQPGKPETALAHFREALRIAPQLAEARLGLFGILSSGVSFSRYIPELDGDLKECFESPIVMNQSIAYLTAEQLRRKYALDVTQQLSGEQAWELATRLGSDELFHLLLRKTININPEFEKTLMQMRRVMLFIDFDQLAESGSWQNFLISIAHQCFNNEYVFSFYDKEEREVQSRADAIELELQSGLVISPALERNVLLLGMYMPLYKQPFARKLERFPLEAWSFPMRELVTFVLYEPLEEENIKDHIPPIGETSDPVSHEVKAQYEENPYPRWISRGGTAPQNFHSYFCRQFPHFAFPEFLKNPVRVLNAGCGSGQSPIQSALAFRNAEFLGVDLSLSSLAYAKRMAGKYGVTNVEFMQGDILNLSDLNQKFHIIESIGVLHHMENPEKGWSVLSDLLVPGGMMMVGLYSEIARRDIVQARKEIAARGLMPENADIRSFRLETLTNGADFSLSGIYRSEDFFSMSGCRDLLFHVQEHRYSVPQIKKMIERQKLTFVGFQSSSPSVKEKYQTLFPGDPNMTDLDLWEEYENLHPDTFGEMYIFWCQKKLPV